MNLPALVDPVCLVHGLPLSQHSCLYCCLCFVSLTPEECNVMDDGSREDVCKACALAETQAEAGGPVVFLDFDGVWMLYDAELNLHKADRTLLARINRLLSSTHAIPVVVSTRRSVHSEETMAAMLRLYGFANVLDGSTMVDSSATRQDAILAWLAAHPYVRHWIVLDDEARHYDGWSDELKQHLILTNSRYGIQGRQVQQAVALLRGEPAPPAGLPVCADDQL